MNTKIFYTVNAGLHFRTDKARLLVDAIHGGPEGFTPMPPELLAALAEGTGIYKNPDGLLFTHLHSDHYDAALTGSFLARNPGCALWGPGLTLKHLKDLDLAETRCRFRIGEFQIYAYRTRHTGKTYEEVPHTSLLIKNASVSEAFLISGDSTFSPEMAALVKQDAGEDGITGAFINILHMIEPPSREFLLKLAPRRVFLYHRPYTEEDVYHYRQLIPKVLEKKPLPGYTVEQPTHMAWI